MRRSRAISTEDHDRISAAIHDAESRTSGEIVCVLAQESTDATALPMLLAALAALFAPWPLLAFTALPVNIILLVQLLTFFVLALVLCLPRVRIALVPRAARRAMAHRMALEQFMIRGIGRKENRTGVLIFVSLAERYARIVADRAIADRVPQSEWQHAVDALISHTSRGEISEGFVAAIERCSRVLEEHFPRSETDRHELPDRIYVI
jgi:putative membrane protein